ncbi:Spore protein SP21 [Planctomycetes bacterium MalM25]|nr:Spore protein SP21 [Planctomycetes bacterium MalM25]
MSKCTPTNRLSHLLPPQLADVDSLVNHFLSLAPQKGVAPTSWSAPASLWEADEKLHVELDVPGVSAEAVEVTVENGQLSITVERSAGENPPTYAYNERRFGKVTRTLDLPDTVDPETVDAQLRDGVLRVSIAKRPETQPRRIDVRQD